MNTSRPNWVTIVSGLPRSGTSMMMQMLAAGGMDVLSDGVRATDDDNQRGYFEFEPVKRTRQDPSWLGDAAGKGVKMVYLLLYDLPPAYEYRVLMMERPLAEVLASQQAMLERRGQPGANLPREKLSELFAQQRERIAQWLAGRPNFRAITVDYHRVLAEPHEQAQRINAFLDSRLDSAAMAAAVAPALRRQTAGSPSAQHADGS
ncbi:MAG: sulfotransferase family protein [Pirellulales bacterium]